MTMQTEHHGHVWTDSLAVQMIAATVVIAAVIALAWYLVF